MIRERILRRFAGTQPRHDSTDWRVLGIDAAVSQRLAQQLPKDPVPAAVLFPLVDRPGGMTVLLTQRASQLARHPAQIAFPGGRVDATDVDAAATALREAREEIGLEPARVQVFGYLPDHVVISGFRVTPVLGLVSPPFSLQLNPHEVAGVFEVPLDHVLDSANHKPRMRKVGDEEMLLFDIPWEGQSIWGATAGMLLTFVRMLREERP